MKNMTIDEIISATGGSLLCGDSSLVVEDITTDSRKVSDKMLFIPLSGERFDGHDYIKAAFESGALAALTHKDDTEHMGTIIKVADTGKALLDIARYYKNKFNIITVSLTGSVGKTTTKDMLASVLERRYKTLKTQGNFNNEIGLPLTVLKLNDEHEAVVLEMGMSGFGEIHRLVSVARPDVAVITNIGMSHIEKLGSQEGILKAKLEITDFFNEDNKLVVNGDDKLLSTIKNNEQYTVITYGIDNKECDVVAYNVRDLGIDGVSFDVESDNKKYNIHINVAGVHNVYNSLAAICVGKIYNVPMEDIIFGLENFTLTDMRMSIEKYNDIIIINDCYNASPASMEAALKVLKSAECNRRVAVLGDMLEMGDFAPKAHYDVGKKAFEIGADVIITVGDNAKHIATGAVDAGMKRENIISFDETEKAAEFVKEFLKPLDAVLVKASRGMTFEKIVKKIQK